MKKILFSLICIFILQSAGAEISVEYFGGAERVSGTCALLNTDKTSVIADCGTFYEEDNLEADNKNIPSEILGAKALVLTHAHADHCGKIPLLAAEGFNGKIYCTEATKKIVFEIYNDGWDFGNIKRGYYWSASQRKNCQKKQLGTVTLHWTADCFNTVKNRESSSFSQTQEELSKQHGVRFRLCRKCLQEYLKEFSQRFVTVKYGQKIKISQDVSFTLFNAGHIPGSASILFEAYENGSVKRIFFSGDLGSGYSKLAIAKDKAAKADYIFMESTYGASARKTGLADYNLFQKSIAAELNKDKIVWIPALSLQRTQKVLYEIKKAQDNGIIEKNIPVYSLSPSSNGLTKLYESELSQPSGEKWFDENIYFEKTILPAGYYISKPKKYTKPSIIISASGMMDQGVSRSVLGKLLPRDDVSVFLVSYAGPHTPAGQLKSGNRNIKTKEGPVSVRASVKSFDIFSDHPDINESMRWLTAENKNSVIYLVHGSKEAAAAAGAVLKQNGFPKSEKMMLNKKVIIR